MHDRPFPADRADAQRRRQRLDRGHLRPDAPVELGDGEHHLRHAMTARLRREARHQRPIEQTAHDRGEHHEPDPERGHVRVRDVSGRAVVLVPGEDLRESLDQIAEADRAQARTDADGDRQRDQPFTSRPPRCA
jgi:hypothetical protein